MNVTQKSQNRKLAADRDNLGFAVLAVAKHMCASFGKGQCRHACIQAGPGESQSIFVLAVRLSTKHPATEKKSLFPY